MLLIKRGELKPEKVKESLDVVFSRRKTHECPDKINPPPGTWKQVFENMAKACNVNFGIEEAFSVLEDFFENLKNE